MVSKGELLSIPCAGLTTHGPERREKNPEGSDHKFAELLKRACETTQPTCPEAKTQERIRGEFRRFMVTTVLDHLDVISRYSIPIPEGVHEGKTYLSETIASNFRQDDTAYDIKRALPDDIDKMIRRAAVLYEVDPSLIRSVIEVESHFDPQATSPKGAMGLMQLMPETARELGVVDPYNPEENIKGGTRYLRGLLDRYHGDTEKALAAYNWGMGNVEKNYQRLPAETKTYVARVLKLYEENKG